MKSAIKDFIILTPSENAASKHDYRNKIGVGKLSQEFVTNTETVAASFRESYGKILQKELWLKKLIFMNSQIQSVSGEEPTLENKDNFNELTKGKKYLYIDDEHRIGWSYILNAGLTGDHLSFEFFNSTEHLIKTPNNRLTVIDSYNIALSICTEKKNEFETRLEQWAESDRSWSDNIQSMRIVKENKFVAEKIFNETTKKLIDAEKTAQTYKTTYLEKAKFFQNNANAFALKCAEIVTESSEVSSIDIEDREYQQQLEALNTARRDYVSAYKSYESVQDYYVKLKNDHGQYKQRFEDTKSQLTQAKLHYEQSQKTFEDTQFALDDLFPWNLVFLDLRLEKPDDEVKPVEFSGGVLLLDELKSFDPSIPIIIFTASEKALSYETCMELGADAYWIKGISSGRQLKQYIVDCLETTYLRDIWLKIRKIDIKKELHCALLKENGALESRILNRENLEKKQIVKLLQDSFFLLRQRDSHLGRLMNESDIFAEVVLNMGLIQEIRFKEGGEAAKIDGRTWIKLVKENEIPSDEQEIIRRLRNIAVHAFELRRSGNVRTTPVSKDDAMKAFHLTLDRLLSNS